MQLFNIGTFNFRGLNDPQTKEQLKRDTEIFKLVVFAFVRKCCITSGILKIEQ